MHFVFRTAALAAITLGSAALTASTKAAPATAPVVHIANFTFETPNLVVKRGTTVSWINDDDIPHTVVATDGSFKSKVLDTGDHFSVTFAKAGQFSYFCSIHPHMTGKVVVRP
jgi:amicyanin